MWSKLLLMLAAAAAPAIAAPAGACTCAGGVVGGVCYPTLQGAFDALTPGGTIEVGGKKVLTKQIFFSKSVNLVGVNCGKKAIISANMDAGEGGMLEARGPGRLAISFKDIAFTREAKSGPASAFHGGVLREKDMYGRDVKKTYSDVDGPTIDFTLRGCDFYGLLTKARGGSAIYVMVPGSVDIDGSNNFYENKVTRPPKERYGGGGALWLADISTKSVINISAVWRDNEHLFEHGMYETCMSACSHASASFIPFRYFVHNMGVRISTAICIQEPGRPAHVRCGPRCWESDWECTENPSAQLERSCSS